MTEETVQICGVCGEKAGDPCCHLLSGQPISNNYRHKQGIHEVQKWVPLSEYTKGVERRARVARKYNSGAKEPSKLDVLARNKVKGQHGSRSS